MDWYGVSGRKIRNGYLSESNSGGSLQGKLNGVKVNYWTPFNPSNEFPRPSHNTNVTYHGSLAIQDASYMVTVFYGEWYYLQDLPLLMPLSFPQEMSCCCSL